MVHPQRLAQRVSHLVAQVGRCQDLDIGTETEYIHGQFGVVRVGHGEQIAALIIEMTLLLRILLFPGHPA